MDHPTERALLVLKRLANLRERIRKQHWCERWENWLRQLVEQLQRSLNFGLINDKRILLRKPTVHMEAMLFNQYKYTVYLMVRRSRWMRTIGFFIILFDSYWREELLWIRGTVHFPSASMENHLNLCFVQNENSFVTIMCQSFKIRICLKKKHSISRGLC